MGSNLARLEVLFHEALSKAPEARAAYLDQACGADMELRCCVERLLASHIADASFMKLPDGNVTADANPPLRECPGTFIGPYKLLEQIGEGGFGIVYMAEQERPIRRKVALKIIKPGMDTRQVIARFEAERQALALMDHPNIAKVFDAGETTSGRPYFVMELVKGVPVTTYCDQVKLPLRERLELFTPICQAVQHAHYKGIIHRDLKPTNILITLHDGQPVVKVIDFGIAKATGQVLTDKTLFTGFAQVVGTPLYASPEQVALSGLDIDTRTDVYSLGVLLYELLTGTTPFEKERMQKAALEEMRRIVREEDPPRPSTRMTTVGERSTLIAAQRASQPRRLAQIFRRELDWIVMKALEKDRTRRYETPVAFAGDIARYLANDPVEARPPSTAYRVGKFVRRHRWGTGVAAAAILLLGTSTVLIWRAKRATAAALQSTKIALDTAEERRVVAVHAEKEVLFQLADNYTSRGFDSANTNWNARPALWFAKAAVTARDDPIRVQHNLGRVNSWLQGSWTPVAAVGQGVNTGDHATFDPVNSRYLMTYTRYGAVDKPPLFWDLATEKQLQPPAGFDPPSDAVWTDRGQAVLGSATGRVALASMPDLKIVRQWDAGGPVKRLAASARAGMVAATSGKNLLVWNMSGEGAPAIFEHSAGIEYAAFSSAGDYLVTATSADNQARVFSVTARGAASPQLHLSVGPVRHIFRQALQVLPRPEQYPAFVSEGSELLTVRAQVPKLSEALQFYDLASGRATRRGNPSGLLSRISVAPDGHTFFSGGRIFDVAGVPIFNIDSTGELGECEFNSDSTYLAMSGNEGVKLYRIGSPRSAQVGPNLGKAGHPAFSKDNRYLAVLDNNGMVQVWQLPSSDVDNAVMGLRGGYYGRAFLRDGQFVGTVGKKGSTGVLQVYETPTGKPVGAALPLECNPVLTEFWPNGESVAVVSQSRFTTAGTAYNERQLHLWNWRTGEQAWEPMARGAEPVSLRFAPDGKTLAMHCIDGEALLIDTATGHVVLHVQCASTSNVTVINSQTLRRAIAFSHDGRTIYTWGSPVIQAWDRATGHERFAIRLTRACRAFAESPDGRMLATGTADGELRIWDAANGREMRAPMTHPDAVSHVTFSPDGRLVATVCDDKHVRAWDVATGKPVYGMSVGLLTQIQFTPDGRFAVTSAGSSLQIWEAQTGIAVSRMVSTKLGVMPTLDLSADGHWAIVGRNAAVVDLQKLIGMGPSPEQALLWCELLSNSRLAGTDVSPLSGTEWLERWHAYFATYPQAASADFAHTQARADAHPGGEALARQGRFREAAEVFRAETTPLGPLLSSRGYELLQMAAYTHLQAGNQTDYAACCRYLLDNLSTYGSSLLYLRGQIAKLGVLGPSSIDVARWESLFDFKDPNKEHSGSELSWVNLARGMVYYRGGKWQQAVEELTRSLSFPNGPEAQVGAMLYQAMAHWQLHDEEEARSILQKACQLADSKLDREAGLGDLGTRWMDWIVVYRARQEAETLINTRPTTTPPAGSVPSSSTTRAATATQNNGR